MSESTTGQSARVLLVDDHPVFREGLARYLLQETWVSSVLHAATAGAAEREALIGSADIVVMDLKLPDADGLAATRRVLRVRPAARVVVVTADERPTSVTAALAAGARGYLLKQTDPDDMVEALHTVWRGGIVLGAAAGDEALARLREQAQTPPPFDRLDERELNIISMLASGMRFAEIARRLGLAEHTVRNRMRPICDKLGAADRAEAQNLARSAGLIWPRS